MIPSEILYRQESAAWLLLLAPLFLLLFWFRKWRSEEDIHHISTMKNLLHPRSFGLELFRCLLLIVSWMMATLAVMQPYLLQRSPESVSTSTVHQLHKRPHDILFVLDTSASMSIPDMGTGQTRLDFAKEIVDATISRLGSENVGLYAFTSVLTPVSPPTFDHLFVRLMLNGVGINEGDVTGTDFKTILSSLQRELSENAPDKTVSVVLLSDGGDTQLESFSGSARDEYQQQILDAWRSPIKMSVIGVGSKTGGDVPGITAGGQAVPSALDEALLQQLAERTHGNYVEGSSRSTWSLGDQLATALTEETRLQKESSKVVPTARPHTVDLFQIPLFMAILLLGAAIGLPATSHQPVREVA